jgi:vacuolar-type H+-ATPase subunit F/Vma7
VQPAFHPNPNPGPGRTEESLGTQTAQGFTLQGIRKTRTVSANLSGTGQPITISDEYWYSADLDLVLVTKHNDPRTGEQIVTVKNITRAEPDATLLSIPADYKVVDETVPAAATAAPVR